MGEFKHTEKYVKTFADQTESEIETRLKNNGKYASGDLYDSIRYEIKENNLKWTISFHMLDYGKFVDRGVNGYDRNRGSEYGFKSKDGKGTGGKSEFITSLQKWCKIRGLPVGMAFPIRKNIWKFGIAPTQFFTIPFKRRAKQFEKGIEKAMVMDLDYLLQKEINGLKKKS